jgi:transcriptional regulator with XRE-family HTH domain
MKTQMKPEELYVVLSRNLKARRQELAMTQQQLATDSGVTQSAISRVERGDPTMSLATLAKLAEALHTSPSALLSVESVFSHA